MSRSIHVTRRAIADAESDDYRDVDAQRRRVGELRELRATKKRIEAHVRDLRRLRGCGARGAGAALPPIRVLDASPHVHYPASPEDLVALLRRLPRGIADGLGEIRFELGRDVQRELARDPRVTPEPDPYVGRFGDEIFPGVFVGDVLGQYHPRAASIHVFAYVYDEGLPHRSLVETYLRMQMLATFVHEMAHHFDFVHRVARDRWRADERYKNERYAEIVEHDWVATHVIPYLREAHGPAVGELERWVEENAGVALSLELLAGDPRTTGPMRQLVLCPPWSVLRSIFAGLGEGTNVHAIRLDVALDLVLAGHPEEALVAIDSVLVADARSHDARIAKARVLRDLARPADAREVLEPVLRDDPRNVRALTVQADLAFGAWAWFELAAIGEIIEHIEGKRARGLLARHLARAHLELGRWAELERALDALDRSRSAIDRAAARGLRAIGLVRRGRDDEALAVAQQGLKDFPNVGGNHLLAAVRLDVLDRIGRGDEADPLSSFHLDRLERTGFGAWARHIRALSAASARPAHAGPGRRNGRRTPRERR